MKTGRYIFSSESVTEGHPDKMADQISDAVLDAILTDDENGRVACETLLTTGLCVVSGEITTDTYVDIPSLARRVIHDIGYTRAKYGFDADTCGVITAIQHQSPDIAQGVDTGGAGDQGMMFGFACNETPELMPLPISLAHKLTRKLSEVRRDGVIPFLRPDGKSQVSIKYDGYKPVGISTVLISSQHDPAIPYDTIKEEIIERVIKPTLPRDLSTEGIEYLVNPTGKFAIGGPQGDTGLTGRKIIVDTYGGSAPHGGGAFSGKDPTKVDRSGAYMARYVAKNLVAAGFAERVQLQVAYAIGVAQPVSLEIETYETGIMPESEIEKLVRRVFDFQPAKIIQALNLRRPIYRQTAAYGHFGRAEFPWEETDMVDTLKKEAGIA
ncbi:MAG: methionine adenosyltransferase [Armatimonadetes bacterium]|nr:methionine adenosyltransferase [Armatimonadota bacterium]